MTRTRDLARAGAVILALACAAPPAGCGRKGPPRPPESVVPVPVTDLTARATPVGIELTWSRPATDAGGRRLLDLAGFVIERSADVGAGFAPQRLADLPVADRDRLRKISRFTYVDATARAGVTYRYRVVSYTDDGYRSAPSNVATAMRDGQGPGTDAPLPAPQR